MKSMRRLLLLLWASGALPLPLVVADPGWVWQNPRLQGNTLSGVAVLDAQTVVAVERAVAG